VVKVVQGGDMWMMDIGKDPGFRAEERLDPFIAQKAPHMLVRLQNLYGHDLLNRRQQGLIDPPHPTFSEEAFYLVSADGFHLLGLLRGIPHEFANLRVL
jgi:hypothetical protein